MIIETMRVPKLMASLLVLVVLSADHVSVPLDRAMAIQIH
jgi:hypothetical protein